MVSTAATLMLLAFLLPTTVVFVISYRHALRTWLVPRASTELPVATAIASGATTRARPRSTPAVSFSHRFHAAIIATAFASVFTMALIALALVATAIAAT